VIWIAPRDELATKEKLELEAQQQISELEPLRTETFQLNYTKADQLAVLLRGGTAAGGGQAQPLLSKRGSVVHDARTNTLFVQDIPSRLEAVRRVIATTDIPVRQVMIEARIVEANDKFARTLGVRLGTHWTVGSRIAGNTGSRYTVGGNLVDTGVHSGQPVAITPVFPQDTLSVNLPAQATPTGAAVGQFSMVLFNSAATKFLNLELTALESDGKGKIISSPRVVTANQIEALIEQGTEIPYQQATSSGATSVAFRKAVLALRVKPQITPDGNVIMDVDVNKDAVGVNTAAGPSIDTKHVKTSVLVENGGTVVIGGIYTQEDRADVNKIPFFGDLPYVGPLFRNYYRQDNKTELLVFLTPRILDERLSVR
jgi:type IV pilus assembly protein PilQ